MTDSPWPFPVKEFKCHQCGNCCRGDGYVELTEQDIEAISQHLQLSREDFFARYCSFDQSTMRWHLLNQGDPEISCIFLTPDNRCQVHTAKPHQCTGFPTRWRSDNILDYCDGWRALEGLPPATRKMI
ncbi:MAG: YkgJ family cysteine cluster protein [Candidatus Sumerlaeia bacterium]|nr:YkgJ family cysteine cluster protein [Candidatus Sumerlaeia bacterium]